VTVAAITIFRKTVGDLANPKVLAAYLVVFGSVGTFLGFGFGSNVEEVTTLAAQETALLGAFLPLSYFWSAGIPLLALGAVFGAVTLAGEAERGSLRILLSKPVRRWEVLVGTVLALTLYTTLVAVASVLYGGVALFYYADVGAEAIGVGVFEALPGMVLYALFVSAFLSAFVVALAVFTTDRLRTALVGLLPAVSFLGLWITRLMVPGSYEEYSLYLVDPGYHLGHVFLLAHRAAGTSLPTQVKAQLGFWTGIYELPGEEEAMPETLELVGHVEPVVSLAALSLLAVGLFAAAVVRFQRMDL
jgi:ABC-2 type transport system permease protein